MISAARPCEPEVRWAVCEAALKTYEAMGCVVEPAAVGASAEDAWHAFMRLRHWQAGSALKELYDDPAKRPLLKPEAVFEVESGLALSAFDITAASMARAAWKATRCAGCSVATTI